MKIVQTPIKVAIGSERGFCDSQTLDHALHCRTDNRLND